jgi:hypothetical protein
MFDLRDSQGKPIDRAYAERRAAHEPLAEVANLGASETHPALSPRDPFSRFELFGMERMDKPQGSYVRDALGRGIEIAQQTGVNPYTFGFVASTDYSNGLSDSAESAFLGGRGAIDPAQPLPPRPRAAGHPELSAMHPPGAGSLTGVWAEQNTRESIFDAFRRKETFGTSGTRLKLRFFGGWQFEDALSKNKNWIRVAYCRGVPMGGTLPGKALHSEGPRFVVWASKDPQGANLDRAQVVKLTLQDDHYVERIYDVALSDGRAVDTETGGPRSVGNTVDLKAATYTNAIGAEKLFAVWQDVDFDPKVQAVYYLRVLEIPTPRWSTIAAVRRGEPLSNDVPAAIQERGWSSPIWYTPALR